jgi:similar to spore coat protein
MAKKLGVQKSLCMTKSTTMSGLTQDLELKAMLLNDAGNGLNRILTLKDFLTNRGNM